MLSTGYLAKLLVRIYLLYSVCVNIVSYAIVDVCILCCVWVSSLCVSLFNIVCGILNTIILHDDSMMCAECMYLYE